MNKKEKGEVAAPTLFDANHEDYVQVLNGTKVAQISEKQKLSPENVEVLEAFEAVKTTATMPRITRDEQPTGEAFKSGFLSKQETQMLPIKAMRPEVQTFIEEVTAAFGTHRDFIVADVFGAVSATVGTKFILHEQGTMYLNPPVTWILNIAPSGYNKSEPQKVVFDPVEDLNAEMHYQYEKAFREWNDTPKKKPSEQPTETKLLIDDFSNEKLFDDLANNPHGLSMVLDEAEPWVLDMNRYNSSGIAAKWVSYFGGRKVDVGRLGRFSKYARKRFLSVFGNTQTDQLPILFGTEKFRVLGFTARILFTMPEVYLPDTRIVGCVSDAAKWKWKQYVDELFRFRPQQEYIEYAPDASQRVKEYSNELSAYTKKVAAEAVTTEDNDNQRSMSKLAYYLQRFAAIYHLLGDTYATEVSLQAVEAAIEAVEVYKVYARRANSLIAGADRPKRMTQDDIIRLFGKTFKIENIQQFADTLRTRDGKEVARQTISRALNREK